MLKCWWHLILRSILVVWELRRRVHISQTGECLCERDYSRSVKVEIKTTSIYRVCASAEQVEMVVNSIARIIYTSYRRLHDAAFELVLQWYDPVRRVWLRQRTGTSWRRTELGVNVTSQPNTYSTYIQCHLAKWATCDQSASHDESRDRSMAEIYVEMDRRDGCGEKGACSFCKPRQETPYGRAEESPNIIEHQQDLPATAAAAAAVVAVAAAAVKNLQWAPGYMLSKNRVRSLIRADWSERACDSLRKRSVATQRPISIRIPNVCSSFHPLLAVRNVKRFLLVLMAANSPLPSTVTARINYTSLSESDSW